MTGHQDHGVYTNIGYYSFPSFFLPLPSFPLPSSLFPLPSFPPSLLPSFPPFLLSSFPRDLPLASPGVRKRRNSYPCTYRRTAAQSLEYLNGGRAKPLLCTRFLGNDGNDGWEGRPGDEETGGSMGGHGRETSVAPLRSVLPIAPSFPVLLFSGDVRTKS